MSKTIITVVGKDTVGIIARISNYLLKANINILDISQTVVQEYFHMMMITDMSKSSRTFDRVSADLAAIGAKMGQDIRCQKSEIFEKMHRI